MADYNYDDYGHEDEQPRKATKGYQIIIIVLAVILAGLSFIYFRQMRSLKEEYAIERDTLTNQITKLMGEYENIKTENDTIAYHLDMERDKVDSLMQSLTKEKTLNRQKIRQYEKELGTLRSVMRTYVHQIDSLNTLNKNLIAENVEYRKQVTTQRQRAEIAEEKADELSVKVRKGAVVRARDITLKALSKNDREVSRASRAVRLRVDLTLAANELAAPGERTLFVRIVGPDGYVMANADNAAFDFEGETKVFSARRDIDYQNQDLGVSLYYNGSGITGGKYAIEVYMDGYLIGSTELQLR
jgi:hypothetical protein